MQKQLFKDETAEQQLQMLQDNCYDTRKWQLGKTITEDDITGRCNTHYWQHRATLKPKTKKV